MNTDAQTNLEMRKLQATPYTGDGRLIVPLSLKNLKFANPVIEQLKNDLQPYFTTTNKDFKKGLNKTFILFVCNFVCCAFERKPLSIPSSETNYGKDSMYNKLRITWGTKERIVNGLLNTGYIELFVKGNPINQRVNSYIPTTKLEEYLFKLLYSVEEDFKLTVKDLIILRDKEEDIESKKKVGRNKEVESNMRRSTRHSIASNHPDLLALKRINVALSKCTYPLKSPVKRIFSDLTSMKGGRLYTRMQTLPDKKARIRINTHFNGDPVVEVDLSANHPRMIAALNGHELPADFYDEVASKTRTSKLQVKFFYMKAIGAENRSISRYDTKDEKHWNEEHLVLTHEERMRIEDYTHRHLPFLYEGLFKGMGVTLQSLEGDILLKTMLTLLDQDIPSLPMHDAVYVQQQFLLQAKKAIEDAWTSSLNVKFKPFTKIDEIKHV
jgi:hypothetical protein